MITFQAIKPKIMMLPAISEEPEIKIEKKIKPAPPLKKKPVIPIIAPVMI